MQRRRVKPLALKVIPTSTDDILVVATHNFTIREPTFAEMFPVADVIMASFYEQTTGAWKHIYRLAEVNRIQQNFPHQDRQLHRMLVATVSVAVSAGSDPVKERIVGFCDIDARPANQKTSYTYNPRPYLSDLCIHPEYRRYGIGRAMVHTCEQFCRHNLEKQELFIRVEKTNEVALSMYDLLGYRLIETPDDNSSSKVIMLRKDLQLYQDRLFNPILTQDDANCTIQVKQ